MNRLSTPFFSIFLLAVLSLSVSCNDDDIDTPPEEQDPREEAIYMMAGESQKEWLISQVLVNGADVTHVLLEECDLDDRYTFIRGGSGEIRGGELKCEEDEPDVLGTGSWELHDDLETITMETDTATREFQILQLTEDALSIQLEEDGSTYTANYEAAQN